MKHAINTETNEAVAIKVLDKEKIQKQNMGNQIKKEISIMKMVKHKYVVGMIEVLASKTKIFIVLELVTGGELFDKIVSVGKLQEAQARFYFSQLVEGVEYCHKLGVCHRDLKPENLLVDEAGNLKISDFGLSSLYVGDAEGDGASRTQLLHTTCGTPNYVAPEVLADKGYDGKKADVWSCGVILYVLVAGFLPFDEGTIVALFSKIQNADFTYPSWFSPSIRSLLDTMLVADPKTRISLTKVREHPWMTEGLDASPITKVEQLSPPSLLEINEAVQPTNASGEDDFGGEDEDDEFGNISARGPRVLNAFELINQCGGFLLDRMFSPQLFNIHSNDTSSNAANDPSTHKVHKVIARTTSKVFGNSASKSRMIHYTSPVMPSKLISEVYNGLIALGCTVNCSKERVMVSGKLFATRVTSKGMVAIHIQAFEITSSLSLLSVRRGKGDLLEWTALFTELVESKIPSFVNIIKD